jgi:gamma-glutamylcyclotransferase (GGCT)/AIG2-like uncharacterized protein YtfP
VTAADLDVERRLFVYGTLAPGQANHELLVNLQGSWHKGTVSGYLYPNGIGPTAGYPVVDLTGPAQSIEGFILISDALPGHWLMLDDFEGEGYRRVKTMVTLPDKSRLEAFIYVLDTSLVSPGRDQMNADGR